MQNKALHNIKTIAAREKQRNPEPGTGEPAARQPATPEKVIKKADVSGAYKKAFCAFCSAKKIIEGT